MCCHKINKNCLNFVNKISTSCQRKPGGLDCSLLCDSVFGKNHIQYTNAYIVSTATDADRLTMDEHRNVTWSLSHNVVQHRETRKNTFVWLLNTLHKRDIWRPAMSHQPSLTSFALFLLPALIIKPDLAPSHVHCSCQPFFYSCASSIHQFILIHACHSGSRAEGGKKNLWMYVCR